MHIKTADRCAWRAFYVYAGQNDGASHRQLFYAGIDPTRDRGPQVFGGITFGWPHPWTALTFRFTLPHITWRLVVASRYNRAVKALYRAQGRLLNAIDGRY